MRKRRRHFLKIPLLLLLLLGLLCADSGLRLVTTEYELAFSALPEAFDGFRIVQLSDLHGAQFGAGNARLLRRVAAAAPDLIALTGDLADRDTDLAVIDTLLAGLAEIAPVYYVSGNHEWSADVLEALQTCFARRGVVYLRNDYVLLERGGARIALAGVEDPNGWRTQPKPDTFAAALRQAEPETFTVLLGHRNDWIEKYPALPVQLILCGHAHGGIVRLPGLGGVLGTGGTLFPGYTAGVYRAGTYCMVVSRGLGGSVPVPRFLNNPEIVSVSLKCA